MFTYGTDPEFMLFRNGKPVSAIGVVPGTKEHHHMVGANGYYYDNVLAEMTTVPGSTREETVANIKQAIQNYATLVHPCKLVAQASVIYPPAELKHKKAMDIGCTPEFDAYGMCQVKPPEDIIRNTGLRSAGGHIHIGTKFAQIKHNKYGYLHLTRMLDLFLGIPSIYLDHDKTSPRRKELYGKAGRYRTPKYGLEYRSMGNFWLTTPKMTELVYDIVDFTIKFCEDGRHLNYWFIDEERLNSEDAWNEDDFSAAKCHQCKGYDVESMRCAIDNMDRQQGKDFVTLIKGLMPPDLFGRFEKMAADKKKHDLYKAWGIHAS